MGTMIKPGDGVGPPPAEKGVQSKTAEQDGRQVGAQVGLPRVCFQGTALQTRGHPTLRSSEKRHDDQ